MLKIEKGMVMNRDNFFIIDSQNYNLVSDGLYGFVVSVHGIFDSCNFAELHDEYAVGNGVYVLVRKIDETVTITQDFNGSFGLYLYQYGDYFAVANSLSLLVEYLSHGRKLTLNKDYANDFLVNPLASRAVRDTIINEITTVERNKKVIISNGKIQFESIDYKENTVAIDSQEGIEILDRWYQKWIAIIRGLTKTNAQVMADLTGGFDSRTALVLLVASGIDLSKVGFNSFRGKAYTYAEDYEIASLIAKGFGFELNRKEKLSEDAVYYSEEEVLENAFFTKFAVHKEFFFEDRKYKVKRYKLTGDGGESIKGKQMYNRENFITMECGQAKRFSNDICTEICTSVLNNMDDLYDYIGQYYHLKPDYNDGTLAHRETWNRSHFGKNAVEMYLNNTYRLQPLIDPDLYRLVLDIGDTDDENLLLALIFVRYCSNLLNYRFQGGRKLSRSTITKAKQISDKFKFTKMQCENEAFNIATEDSHISGLNLNDKTSAKKSVNNRIIRMCESGGRIKDVFCDFFSEELYRFARFYLETEDYVPLKMFFGILAVTWAANLSEKSQTIEDNLLLSRIKLLSSEKAFSYIMPIKEFGFPYDRVDKNSNIILYGAGEKGFIYKRQLDFSKHCKIVHWVDKRFDEIGNGVESPDIIRKSEFDYVILAIKNVADKEEVVNYLTGISVSISKIIY